jgi:hypothetical protein
MYEVDDEVVAAWVRATCAAQGVPEKVADAAVLRRVGDLLVPREAFGRAHGA